ITPLQPDAGDTIHVAVAITDASPIANASARLTRDGGFDVTQPLAFDAQSSTYGATFSATGHAGAYELTLTATDTFDIDATPLTQTVDVAIEPLVLTSASPPKGTTQGGTLLTLTGSGFSTDVATSSLKLYASGKPCTHVVAASNTQLTARTPKLAAGPVVLEVRASKLGSALSATLAGAFAVFEPPTIASVSPGFGSAHAGAIVVVSGSRFVDDVVPDSTTVRIGTHVADGVEVVDDATLVAHFSGGGPSESKVDVVVANSRGQVALADAFTWTSIALRPRSIVTVPAPVRAIAAAATSGPHASSLVLGMPDDGARGALALLDLADDSLTMLPAPPAPFLEFGSALLELGDTNDASGLAIRVGAPATDAATAGGAIAAITPTVDAATLVESAGVADAESGAALAPLLDTDADGTIDVWAAGSPGDATVRIHANGVAGAEATWSDGDPDSRGGAALAARAIDASTALLLIGAPDAAPLAQSGAGSAFLVRVEVAGSTVATTQLARIDGSEPGAATADDFSLACSMPGDLDGDGTPDAVVGFPGTAGRGRVVACSGTTGATLWTRNGDVDGDAFGAALTALDDLDGDGIVELCVGAPGADEPAAIDVGAIHVISGKTGQPLARIAHSVAGARLGAVLGTSTDQDGDLLFEVVAATNAISGSDAVVVLTPDPRSCARRAFAGDRLTGSLRDATERDGLWHGVLVGESLEWTLKGSTDADPLRAVLLDVDGTLIASSDPTSAAYDSDVFVQETSRLVVRYTADATRSVALVVGDPAATGKRPYQLRSRRTTSATRTDTQTIPIDGSGGVVDVEFDASALAKVNGAVVAADGQTALALVALESPSTVDLASSSPKAFVTGKPAHAVKIKPKKLTVPETGTYVLRIDPATGGATTLDAKLTLKLRRGKANLKD
ncbi:MAG: IPT/TIG domain-containing protein, partial [Planctomycetes bacterium]|nr:IPT/TIG domain-containing protein [Planctomycetota bacterium]